MLLGVGPKLKDALKSPKHAALWVLCMILGAYFIIPAAADVEKVADHYKSAPHAKQHHVNPWAKSTEAANDERSHG